MHLLAVIRWSVILFWATVAGFIVVDIMNPRVVKGADAKATVEPWQVISGMKILSMQTNNRGAVAVLQGKCEEKRIEFIAIVVDDNGQPTLDIKTTAKRESDLNSKYVLLETNKPTERKLKTYFDTSAGAMDIVIDMEDPAIQMLYSNCF